MDTQRRTIETTIRNVWLQIIQSELTNVRITDYAKPMSDLLSYYTPSLFSTTQNRMIQQWMIRARDFLFAQSFGSQALHPTSNWQFYRLWVMSQITVILKQPTMIQRLRTECIQALQRSISPTDGSLEDFRHRDSVEYHVYTLYAILQTIQILTPAYRLTDGTRVWDVDTTMWTMVMPAIEFMMQYAQGEKTHLEFVNSRQASDRLRAEYNKPFVPSKCDYVLRVLWDSGYYPPRGPL